MKLTLTADNGEEVFTITRESDGSWSDDYGDVLPDLAAVVSEIQTWGDLEKFQESRR